MTNYAIYILIPKTCKPICRMFYCHLKLCGNISKLSINSWCIITPEINLASKPYSPHNQFDCMQFKLLENHLSREAGKGEIGSHHELNVYKKNALIGRLGK